MGQSTRQDEKMDCGCREVRKRRKVAHEFEYGWQIGFGMQLETDVALMRPKEIARAIYEENSSLERKILKFI